jgi:hypothetical protein
MYTETVYIGSGREILSLYKGLMKHTERVCNKWEDNNNLPHVDIKGVQGIELYLAQEYSISWTPRVRIMGKNEAARFLLERCE